jgi:polyisoprenoid-binding protein YceI
MGLTNNLKTPAQFRLSIITLLWLLGAVLAQSPPREVEISFVPDKTLVNFTLGDVLHTVHGSFDVKRGAVHFDPATNKVSGEILVDATSGHSGSDMRDKKMHKEVLESGHFPEIVFRPDRVEGQVATGGSSTIQVHGMFTIHGAEHEISIPVVVEMAPGKWTATSHFVVPYVSWGMKNPSTFVLRVNQSVDIDVRASGEIP